MKRLAIALILAAAVPAVASASSDLMNEVSGKNEVVAESSPSFASDERLISSKSSRPQLHRNRINPFDKTLEANSNVDWQ